MFFKSGQLELKVDLHSHLVPGVDDGAKTLEEAIQLVKSFQNLGYQKVITTPHISENYYPNSVQKLKERFAELTEECAKQNINIELLLGAEYMVDGMLLDTLKSKQELLSWSGHLLIETSFQTLPLFTDEVIFEIQSQQLIPVLAHPERYPYFYGKTERLTEMRMKGVKMQITSGSLAGYYGPEAKKMAEKLVKQNMVDFVGSDVHGSRHMEYLEKGLKSKLLRRKSSSDFLNDQLLG